MASRVMHLAAAQGLLARRTFQNPQAFLAGALLPDAPRTGDNARASHFISSRAGKRTYDLAEFRRLYGEELAEEGLYLGYYLHLIQDIVYRRLIYGKYGLRRSLPEQLDNLYQDYSILNGYIIEKHRLDCPNTFPAGIENAAVCRKFGLNAQGLLVELRGDFSRKAEGETALFSREMAEEYIQSAIGLCETELDTLAQGLPPLDPWTLAWTIKKPAP